MCLVFCLSEDMDSGQQLQYQHKDSGNLVTRNEGDIPSMLIDEHDELFVINSSIADNKEPNLREHTPMTYLLKKIPKHGQKGYRTLDIKLTCVAALTEYIALGSNVGIVYLYNRKEHNLLRLRSEGYTGPITCIQMCKSVDYMIAAGTKDGRIFCHQLPRISQDRKQETLIIRGIHKESITCLEWSKNAEKIFSGDANGVVVCTIIEYGESIGSSSQSLVQEDYPIVQLSYSYRKLLIGSTFRSVIYNPSSSTCVQKIGQRDRKDLGKYGVIFFPLYSPTYEYMLYAARPNLHLWKCNSTGEVVETILLKEIIKDSISTIPLLQTSQQSSPPNEHVGLGLLNIYAEKYLISWNETSLIIIDPNKKAIVGSCWDLNNVLDLNVCGDEIFILQQDFHLIRLAAYPEIIKEIPDAEDKLLKAIVTPFKQLETSWKHFNIFEKNESEKPENENIFSWLRKGASNMNLSTDTSRGCELQFALTPVKSNIPDSDCKVVLAENNCEGMCDIERNNFVLKQELNSSELKPSASSEQSDNSKIDFSHIKIDEVDKIVHTKTKRIKKKHKKTKGAAEAMFSSTNSLEQGTLLEDETTGRTNALTTSCPEEILSKSDDSVGNKTDICSSITENDSYNNNIKEKTSVEPEKKVMEISDKNFFLKSPYNPELNSSEAYMNSILDTILSRFEIKNQTHKNDENENEETVDASNCSEHIDSGSVQEISSKQVKDEPVKAKLTKLQIGKRVSNQSIQSPDYNVYARTESVTDSNLEITDNSELATVETVLNSNNSLDDDDDKKSDEVDRKALAYPDVWARDRFPSAIVSLAVCNNFICCVDNKNMMYYTDHSGGLSWTIIESNVNKIAVSPTGKVVWILRKEMAYAGIVSKNIKLSGIVWMKVANDVHCFAVDKDYAWYVNVNGEICMQQNMFNNLSHDASKKVALQHPVIHIACCDGIVCVLTNKGKIFYRAGITDYRPEGSSWKEIGLGQRMAINLTIGANVLWIIDHLGNVWFLYDISKIIESRCKSHKWWQVDMSELLFEDSHRSLQRMNAIAASVLSPVVVLPTNLVFLSGGHKPPCIGACDKGVWYCESQGRYLFSNKREIIGIFEKPIPYYHKTSSSSSSSSSFTCITPKGVQDKHGCTAQYHKTWRLLFSELNLKFLVSFYGRGHRWRKVILKATSSSFSWKYISASGMSFEKGVIWGMLKNDDFLCFTDLEQPPFFIHPPKTRNTVCCITAAPEALWVLTSIGEIYVRNGISPLHPEGIHWVRLNITQLSNRLVHITCGINSVWGCDCNGIVYLRVGSLKAVPEEFLHQAWVALDVNMYDSEIHSQSTSYRSNSQLHATKVYTGQNDYMLWALDKKNNIYVREGIFPELPIGTGWVYVKGIQAKELCISGIYVWAVTLNNDIYCRYGITDKNYIGDYWKKLPGNITSLSATSDCRLWAIGPDQVLYEHKMHVLHHDNIYSTTETPKKQEDGWELL